MFKVGDYIEIPSAEHLIAEGWALNIEDLKFRHLGMDIDVISASHCGYLCKITSVRWGDNIMVDDVYVFDPKWFGVEYIADSIENYERA